MTKVKTGLHYGRLWPLDLNMCPLWNLRNICGTYRSLLQVQSTAMFVQFFLGLLLDSSSLGDYLPKCGEHRYSGKVPYSWLGSLLYCRGKCASISIWFVKVFLMAGVGFFLRERNLYVIDNIKNPTSWFENFQWYLRSFKIKNLNCSNFPKGLKRSKPHNKCDQ